MFVAREFRIDPWAMLATWTWERYWLAVAWIEQQARARARSQRIASGKPRYADILRG